MANEDLGKLCITYNYPSSQLACYDGLNWQMGLFPSSWDTPLVFPPMLFDNYVYAPLYSGPPNSEDIITTWERVSLSNTSDICVFDETTCSPGSSCGIINGTMWCYCASNFKIEIMKYESEKLTTNFTIMNASNTYPQLQSICTLDDLILVIGQDSGSGSFSISQGYILWNGTNWIVPSFPNIEFSLTEPINCVTNGSVIWIFTANTQYSPDPTTLISMYYITSSSPGQIYYFANQSYPNEMASEFSVNILGDFFFFVLSNTINVYSQTQNTSLIENALLTLSSFNSSNYITALTGTKDILYLGGSLQFLSPNNLTYQQVAKINIVSGEWLYIQPLPSSAVISAMTMVNENLYVTGNIQQAGNLDYGNL